MLSRGTLQSRFGAPNRWCWVQTLLYSRTALLLQAVASHAKAVHACPWAAHLRAALAAAAVQAAPRHAPAAEHLLSVPVLEAAVRRRVQSGAPQVMGKVRASSRLLRLPCGTRSCMPQLACRAEPSSLRAPAQRC
jgi:hypothetical protein